MIFLIKRFWLCDIIFIFGIHRVFNNELGWAISILLIYKMKNLSFKEMKWPVSGHTTRKRKNQDLKSSFSDPKVSIPFTLSLLLPLCFSHDFIQVWNRSGKLEAIWLQADHKISRVTAAFGKIQWKTSQIPLHARKTYLNPGKDHGEFPVSFFFFFFFK